MSWLPKEWVVSLGGGDPPSQAPGPHTHPIDEVDGLAGELGGKQPSGNYAATSHGHGIGDVSGLQGALDAKQAAGSYSASSHDHAGVYQPAGAYANASHGHAISEVAGLQTALDEKQVAGSYSLASHNHNGVYAPVSHSHAISDVTGLQLALDGKQAAGSYAAASHNHDATYSPVGHVHGNATTALAGFMSAADKTKLDGLGAGDVWTRVGLANDFTNNTVTFNTITGFSFTPPANTNFVIECELLLQTTATATLPRIGVNVGAGQSYGSVEMTYQSSATAHVFANGQFTTNAANVQMAAGTAPATTPYSAYVLVKGRSGAAPGAINIQLASETAATVVTVKAGSEFRRRTI